MAAESISHDRDNFFPAKMTMASFLFNCPKTISDFRALSSVPNRWRQRLKNTPQTLTAKKPSGRPLSNRSG
jgi:hypothetical protein